jgi:hypothetical protein
MNNQQTNLNEKASNSSVNNIAYQATSILPISSTANSNGINTENNNPSTGGGSGSGYNSLLGRISSPAIVAKSIQINRTTPSPGTQKRPPHLRLNN